MSKSDGTSDHDIGPLVFCDVSIQPEELRHLVSGTDHKESLAGTLKSNSEKDSPGLPTVLDALEKSTTSASRHVDGIPDFKPIVIPQTTAKLLNTNISPFARAFPPELRPIITEEEFLKIVDNLNEAFLASPIIQVLGLAGGMMAFDPTGLLGFIGTGIQIGAGLTAGAVSYARTKSYVDSVNDSIFRVWGLRMKVLATQKMMKEVGIPESQRFKLPPLPEHDENWNSASPELDPRRRRLAALGSYVADLDWDVAPMKTPDSFLKKMGSWQAKRLEYMQRRKQEKSIRKVHKHEKAVAQAGNETSTYDAKYAAAAERLASRGNTRWAQSRYKKTMSDIDKDKAKDKLKSRLSSKLKLSKTDKLERKAKWERNKHARKERMFVQRIRWITITKFDWDSAVERESRAETKVNNAEEDEEIDVGIEEVESRGPSDIDSLHDSNLSESESGPGGVDVGGGQEDREKKSRIITAQPL